jgi:predicted outer membrane repeat protein
VALTTGTFVIQHSEFKNNSALNRDGGSIYIEQGRVTLSYVTVSGSRAVYGGGLAAGTNAIVTLNDTVQFISNRATGGGGAVFWTTNEIQESFVSRHNFAPYGSDIATPVSSAFFHPESLKVTAQSAQGIPGIWLKFVDKLGQV